MTSGSRSRPWDWPTPCELSIRRLFTASPAAPAATDDASVSRLPGLSDLQSLIDGLLATVVRAAGDLTDRSGDGSSLDRGAAVSRAEVVRGADGGSSTDPAAEDRPGADADPDHEHRDDGDGADDDRADAEERDGSDRPPVPLPGSLEASELSPEE